MSGNIKCIDYDNKVGYKVLFLQDGILRKAESPKQKEPWAITAVHMHETSQGYTQNQIRKKYLENKTIFENEKK